MSGEAQPPGQAPGDEPAPRRRPLVATVLPLIALAALLGWVAWTGIKTDSGSSRGPEPGTPMPPFAAPIAASSLEGDVNVARTGGEGAAGRRPACEVRGPSVLNSCDLVADGPAAIAFITSGDRQCADELTRLERQARGTGVQVAGVIVRGKRDEARRLVAARRWRAPVAWDRDGVLANLYGVAVCPQVVYLQRGGTVQGVAVGTSTPAATRQALSRLSERGS
ncbi:MAG: hypothetical protein ACKOB9_05030 [Solirubrobacterales bacterium]